MFLVTCFLAFVVFGVVFPYVFLRHFSGGLFGAAVSFLTRRP